MAKREMELKNIGNGLKSINFDAFGGFEGFLQATSNGAGAGDKTQLLRRILPWLAKADDMTALAVSELPFDIMKGGTVYDTSTNWKDRLGGIPNPSDLLYNLASSLCLGKAYVIPDTLSDGIISLQYCAPQTVQPMIFNDLEWFIRTTEQGKTGRYIPADKTFAAGINADQIRRQFSGEMMYFWLPDRDVELGPALATPAGAALLASELLVNVDSTLNTISERGFVPPTLLNVKGTTPPGVVQEAEKKWNAFLRGWRNFVTKIINGDAMQLLRVGSGLDELKGVYIDINKAAVEKIGTAFGIPAALFMSDMAYATEMNAMIKMWYSSSVFIKIYHCIEKTFNTQLLDRFGCKMIFRPETIDAFQEDEVSRASAWKVYVDGGMKQSIAAKMVGLELPEGIEFADLDPEEKPIPPALQPFAGQNNQPGNQPPQLQQTQDQPQQNQQQPPAKAIMPQLDAAQMKDLDNWRQVALRRCRNGKGCAPDFECKALPENVAAPIRERLRVVTNEADVIDAFYQAGQRDDNTMAMAEAIKALSESINKACNLVEVNG